MELDDKELEATKNREKTADEMFEELGYEIEDEGGICRIYKVAKFGNVLTSVFYKDSTDERYRLKIYEKYLTMQELQAINKKVEELGWK